MSSMTEDDGMAKRPSQAENAPTTDHTTGHRSACYRSTEATTCGKPRRRWTVEQKRQIVAESMEPGASAATVAGKYGISSGQFYAWRQQLLLDGALGAAAETTPDATGVEVATPVAHLEAAIPASPELEIPATPPTQPDSGIVLAGNVSVPVNGEFGVEDAPMT